MDKAKSVEIDQDSVPVKASKKSLHKPVKLFNRNYLILWQGQFVSRIGNVIFGFAMTAWFTFTLDSPALLGLYGMAAGIPAVIFGIIGGTIADSYSRKKIIVYTDAINGILVIALALLFFLLPDSLANKNDILLIGVFTTGIFSAITHAFFGPAVDAALPDIVPLTHLAQANSFGQLSRRSAQFIGQAFGARLFAVLGAPVFILVNGISYIFSAVSEMFIHIPQNIPEKSKVLKDRYSDFRKDLGEGFTYILKNKGLKKLVFVSIFTSFFMQPIIILLAFYVKDVLGLPERWYGYLMISFGIGALIGYLSVAIFRISGKTRSKIVILFLLIQSGGFIVLGFVSTSFEALLVTFIGGIFNGYVLVNLQTIIQMTVPSEIRGRVMGLLTTISASAVPLGQGLSGFLAEIFSIQFIYITIGAIMVVIYFFISLNRDFRIFISYDPKAEEEFSGFNYKVRRLDDDEKYLIEQLKYEDLF